MIWCTATSACSNIGYCLYSDGQDHAHALIVVNVRVSREPMMMYRKEGGGGKLLAGQLCGRHLIQFLYPPQTRAMVAK